MIGDILSPTHLLFVLVVALLVLGPKRLPEAGRALGRGIRDFRSAMSGDEDHHSAISGETTATSRPATTATAAEPTATAAEPTATATRPTATAPATPAHPANDAADEQVEEPSEIAHPMG